MKPIQILTIVFLLFSSTIYGKTNDSVKSSKKSQVTNEEHFTSDELQGVWVKVTLDPVIKKMLNTIELDEMEYESLKFVGKYYYSFRFDERHIYNEDLKVHNLNDYKLQTSKHNPFQWLGLYQFPRWINFRIQKITKKTAVKKELNGKVVIDWREGDMLLTLYNSKTSKPVYYKQYRKLENMGKKDSKKGMSYKEFFDLSLTLLEAISKTYYYKDSIDEDALLDDLKNTQTFTKENLYKIINKHLKNKSGFYTKDELKRLMSIVLIKDSTMKIKKIKDITYVQLDRVQKEDLVKLKELFATKPKKVILDLRNNIYSDFDVMLELADMLVDSGVIVSKRFIDDKGKSDSKSYKATKEKTLLKDSQIAILINKYTTSSVEAIAHGLRSYPHIVTVGQDTIGKTTYFTFGELKNGDTFALTNGEYYFGDHFVVNGVGFSPERWVNEDNSKIDKTLIAAVKFLEKKGDK